MCVLFTSVLIVAKVPVVWLRVLEQNLMCGSVCQDTFTSRQTGSIARETGRAQGQDTPRNLHTSPPTGDHLHLARSHLLKFPEPPKIAPQAELQADTVCSILWYALTHEPGNISYSNHACMTETLREIKPSIQIVGGNL